MGDLPEAAVTEMFQATKTVLAEMTAKGGRDTEKDLFDQPGGYATVLSRNTVDKPCPACHPSAARPSEASGTPASTATPGRGKTAPPKKNAWPMAASWAATRAL